MSKSKVYYIVWPNPFLRCKVSCREKKKMLKMEKMLMFAKISLESIAYDFTETFFFPNKKTRKIYHKYLLEQVFLYSVLTDRQHLCIFHFHLQTGKWLAQFQVQRCSFWSDSWKWNFAQIWHISGILEILLW